MKILFLSTPAKKLIYPPLGIAYITSFLNEKSSHEAIIEDGNNKTFKQLINAVDKIKPDIVGITMITSNRFECLELAKEIKSRFKIPVLLGGVHPTLMYEQLMENYPHIDYIIRNEGEYVCLNLLEALEQSKPLKNVKGLSYRDKGKIIHNPQAEPIKDLDSLPYPEYKFFDLKNYGKNPCHPKEITPEQIGCIISSRGCPYRCTFCSSSTVWGNNVRFRKPESIINEIEQLYKKYNISYIVFIDDTFIINQERVIKICKLMIKKGLHKKIAWNCNSEVNAINKKVLHWLKKANCDLMLYGVEDASPEGLKFFKKAHNMEQVYKAFKMTNDAGIKTLSYFIIGGDHESLENIELKKRIIEKLNPYATTASLLIVYPKTEIYEIGKKRGWWDDDVFLKPCVGKSFYRKVPIYPSKNLTLDQSFEAVADFDFWWNRKKGNFGFGNMFSVAITLLKNREFSKIYTMSKSILLRSLISKSK